MKDGPLPSHQMAATSGAREVGDSDRSACRSSFFQVPLEGKSKKGRKQGERVRVRQDGKGREGGEEEAMVQANESVGNGDCCKWSKQILALHKEDFSPMFLVVSVSAALPGAPPASVALPPKHF